MAIFQREAPLTGASNVGGVGRNRDSEPISGFCACCYRAFTHDNRYDDRFANLCKVSGRSLADCISMVLTACVDFTKYYYY